jgi:small subunit ribosomal protein S6
MSALHPSASGGSRFDRGQAQGKEHCLNSYELTFIVNPQLEEEALQTVTDRVTKFVVNAGGQVTKVDSWGKRRLAYPIRKLNEGYYVTLHLQTNPQTLRELEHALKLTEEIMRHLLVGVGETAPVLKQVAPEGTASSARDDSAVEP